MTCSKSRQLLLSVAIISLMISATVIVQSATATTLSGTLTKTITLNAGTDGRSFACVNGTWSAPAVQMVNYSYPFKIYPIGYSDVTSTATLYTTPVHGPVYGTPSNSYDPSPYSGPSTGLGPGYYVPKFLIAQNTTNNIVSPTITLTDRDNISLAIGSESDIQVDATSPVVATMTVSSSSLGQLIALTGLVTGDDVTMKTYDPYGNSYPLTIPPGYFAYPMALSAAGVYALYFTSPTSSYITLTPTSLSTTGMSKGQFSTGTLKVPETLNLDALISGDKLPPQIVALSYDVNKGDQYAFAFTANELLTGTGGEPSQSDYVCYYFDVGTNSLGSARGGILGVGGSSPIQPVVSQAVTSGKVYVVLVGNYISRFQYSMGVGTAIVPAAPLNSFWQVSLPTPGGMQSQLYKFSVQNESMVIMNYSNYVHPLGSISAIIYKVTPTGQVFQTSSANLNSGYVHSGSAESNYQYALYMSAGDYMLSFANPSATSVNPSSASIEINIYPIANYTSGSPLSVGVHTTKALAINTATLQFYAFNVTLTSQLNASMTYRMTVFNNQNTYLSTYAADGSSGANHGIGNRESGGSWQGVASNNYYVDPSGQLNFNGNSTTQIDQFVSNYAGRYFLLLSFLNGYNTTTTGLGSSANRWTFYNNLIVTLRIDLSNPNPANVLGGVYEIKTLSLDSSSGSGTTSWTFTSAASANTRLIELALTPQVNTWTRITVTIVNGTAGGAANGTRTGHFELLYDTLRSGQGTFDSGNSLPLLPSLTYYMVKGASDPRTVTYAIEFGAFAQQMMIAFLPLLYAAAVAAHTSVTISVTHFTTPGISGLGLAKGATPISPAGPFPVEIVLVIIVVVVVALVIIFVVVRKRSASGGSRS